MEVTLKNFRCWNDLSIEFGLEGITLLHGASGKGKSSILEAICFALTGTGRNIVTQGKTSCTVTLSIPNEMRICRKRRPNVLKVILKDGREVIDDEAEVHIQEIFTSHFPSIGYLRQGGKNESFVVKSPREKLSFLEMIAFSGVSVASLKQHVREIYREWENGSERYDREESFLQGQLSTCLDSQEPTKLVEDIPRAIEVAEGKKTKLDKAMKSVATLLEKTEKDLQKRMSGDVKLASVQSLAELAQSEVRDSLQQLEDYTDDVKEELETNERILKSLKDAREYRNLKKTLTRDKERLEYLKMQETQELENSIKKHTEKVWKKWSKTEASEIAYQQREASAIFTKRNDLSNEIETLRYCEADRKRLSKKCKEYSSAVGITVSELHEMKESVKIRKCPSCGEPFRVEHGELVSSSKEPVSETEVEQKSQELSDNESKMRKYDAKLQKLLVKKEQFLSLQKRLEALSQSGGEYEYDERLLERVEEYIKCNDSIQRELERLKRQLKRQGYSSAVRELEQAVDKDALRLSELSIVPDDLDVDEDELENKVKLLRIESRDKEQVSKKYSDSQLRLNELETKVSELKSTLPVKDSERIRREVNHYKLQKKKAAVSEGKVVKLLNRLEKYTLDLEAFNHKNTMLDKLELAENEHKELDSKVASGRLMESKIKLAESQCLSSFVYALQCDIQCFLDDFFAEDPMTITMKCFKQIKKVTKPEITILLYYKGLECDYNCLSGGELQRVILAFTLALSLRSEMPFILLDECTSNLDENLTNTVVESIRKRISDRPVVLVAHQVVKGLFDHVVNV